MYLLQLRHLLNERDGRRSQPTVTQIQLSAQAIIRNKRHGGTSAGQRNRPTHPLLCGDSDTSQGPAGKKMNIPPTNAREGSQQRA